MAKLNTTTKKRPTGAMVSLLFKLGAHSRVGVKIVGEREIESLKILEREKSH